jgi:hypothetical protein
MATKAWLDWFIRFVYSSLSSFTNGYLIKGNADGTPESSAALYESEGDLYLTRVSDDALPRAIKFIKTRGAAAGQVGDELAGLSFYGHNDAATPEDIEYAKILSSIGRAADGNETGFLDLCVRARAYTGAIKTVRIGKDFTAYASGKYAWLNVFSGHNNSFDPSLFLESVSAGTYGSSLTLKVQLGDSPEINGRILFKVSDTAVAQVDVNGLDVTGQITATTTPRVIARDATARAMTDSAYTDMIFSVEDLDVDGGYDNTTGIYTVATAGVYLCCWAISSALVAWDAGETWEAYLSKNNSTDAGGLYCGYAWRSHAALIVRACSNGCALISCAATDTLRIKVYQFSGGAINTMNNSINNFFHITRLI